MSKASDLSVSAVDQIVASPAFVADSSTSMWDEVQQTLLVAAARTEVSPVRAQTPPPAPAAGSNEVTSQPEGGSAAGGGIGGQGSSGDISGADCDAGCGGGGGPGVHPKSLLKESDGAANPLDLAHKLDFNGDGKISREELEEPNLPGQYANLARFMLKHYDALKHMENDQFGRESEVTIEDVIALKNEQTSDKNTIESARKVSATGQAVFETIDRDNDQILSEEELRSALKSDTLTGDQRKTLEKLVAEFDKIKSVSNDSLGREGGISQKDLLALPEFEQRQAEESRIDQGGPYLLRRLPGIGTGPGINDMLRDFDLWFPEDQKQS